MVDNVVPLVGIFIHSGDIRDRSVKREITPHFEQFLLSKILGGVAVPQNCTHVIMPASRHVTWKSLVRLHPQPQSFRRAYAKF